MTDAIPGRIWLAAQLLAADGQVLTRLYSPKVKLKKAEVNNFCIVIELQ